MATWWGVKKGTADGQESRGHDKIASGLFEFRKDSPGYHSSRGIYRPIAPTPVPPSAGAKRFTLGVVLDFCPPELASTKRNRIRKRKN
ncbi:unnamed protein product [Sphagnum tenellum]